MDKMIWAVHETPTLREQTVATLREALMNETFAPGEKLVERRLAELTGVSRTSIREALSQLEAEGLVTRISGKGMFATHLTPEDALEIYEARAIVEAAVSRLFVERAAEEDLARLASAIREAEASDSKEQAALHAFKLDAVSDVIVRGAGNEVMRQMSALLRGRITYLRTITARAASASRRRETMALLNGVLDAFRARDADLAEHLMRNYVQRSARFAISVIEQMNDPDDAGQNPGDK